MLTWTMMMMAHVLFGWKRATFHRGFTIIRTVPQIYDSSLTQHYDSSPSSGLYLRSAVNVTPIITDSPETQAYVYHQPPPTSVEAEKGELLTVHAMPRSTFCVVLYR